MNESPFVWVGFHEVDERYLREWFEYGYEQVVDYLAKHAEFDAYCARRSR